jgi:hypothetical protein
VEPRVRVDADEAMRAFDLLERDGPRVVMNELRTLANETKVHGEMRAPGSLASGWRVEAMQDPDTSDTFGWAAMPSDKPRHGGKPVARWVNYGTGMQGRGGARVAHDARYVGQPAQRFLRKVSKAKQVEACHLAIVRTARRLGFEVGGPA